jgi:hypothetical protein
MQPSYLVARLRLIGFFAAVVLRGVRDADARVVVDLDPSAFFFMRFFLRRPSRGLMTAGILLTLLCNLPLNATMQQEFHNLA